MTTTMTEMRGVIRLAEEEGLGCRFMIGGAVVDEAYAREIGAEYSRDAYEAVKLAQRLSREILGGAEDKKPIH
jgi:5-methyltetrahydrofolate--homocysteine methyltransferase